MNTEIKLTELETLRADLKRETENLAEIERQQELAIDDDDAMQTLGDQWDDCAASQKTIARKIDLLVQEQAQAEIIRRRKELTKNVKTAEAGVILAARHAADPAKKVLFENAVQLFNDETAELEKFEASLISPEEREVRTRIHELEMALEELKKELAEKFPEVKVTRAASIPRAAGSSEAGKSGTPPKEDTKSEKRAKVIEMAKAGMTNKEIGIELGYTKEQGYGNGYISPIAKFYRS